MKVLKVTSPASPGDYVLPITTSGEVIEAAAEELGVGGTITIEVIEVTQEEYDALPEFEGGG